MSEKLVFEASVEGLFRIGLKKHLTPELKKALAAEGLNLDQKLLPGYPAEQWARCVKAAAHVVFPNESESDSHFHLGRAAALGFQQTTAGKLVMVLRQLVGTRRMLLRLGRAMSSGCNYMQVTPKEWSVGEMELRFSDVSGVPHFFRGMLNSGTELNDAKDFSISLIEPSEDEGATYHVKWTPV
jgi:uncharacterized protein (TIGR02265 family)